MGRGDAIALPQYLARPRYGGTMAQSEVAAGSFGPNAWLVDDMYDRFLVDPSSVSESWREFFADYRAAPVPAPQAVPSETAVLAAAPAVASMSPAPSRARPAVGSGS